MIVHGNLNYMSLQSVSASLRSWVMRARGVVVVVLFVQGSKQDRSAPGEVSHKKNQKKKTLHDVGATLNLVVRDLKHSFYMPASFNLNS